MIDNEVLKRLNFAMETISKTYLKSRPSVVGCATFLTPQRVSCGLQIINAPGAFLF